MIGTALNTVTVVVGASLGTWMGDRMPERFRTIVMQGIGLATLVLGMRMALGTANLLLVLGSVLIGGLLGELARLDERLEALGRWLEHRAGRYPTLSRGNFARGFVTASLIFCVGPMTILGSIQDGLSGDYQLLAVKSVLDGFVGLALASTLGIGVAFSACTVLVYQGTLTLGAGLFQSVLTEAMITEITAAGGVIILGIGLLLLEIRRIRVANLLPALLVAPALVAAMTALG